MTNPDADLATFAAPVFTAGSPHRLWSCALDTCMDVALWESLSSHDFTTVGIAEALGGSGGSTADAAVLLSLSGRFAAAVPLMEHLWLAGWLLTHAGIHLPKGPMTASFGDLSFTRTTEGWELSGVLAGVPWARSCTEVVVLCPDGAVAVVPVSGCSLSYGSNLIGEPRDDVELRGVRLDADHVGHTVLTRDGFLARGAVGRMIQIDAAAQAALAHSVQYVSEREQFGRPLAQFQAVQQRLAIVARECTLLHAGVQLCLAGDHDSRRVLDIAAAKRNDARSVPEIIANVHQVHGAIGTTSEYGLGELTLRMSSWVAEYGSDAYWSGVLTEACAHNDIWDIVIGAVQ